LLALQPAPHRPNITVQRSLGEVKQLPTHRAPPAGPPPFGVEQNIRANTHPPPDLSRLLIPLLESCGLVTVSSLAGRCARKTLADDRPAANRVGWRQASAGSAAESRCSAVGPSQREKNVRPRSTTEPTQRGHLLAARMNVCDKRGIVRRDVMRKPWRVRLIPISRSAPPDSQRGECRWPPRRVPLRGCCRGSACVPHAWAGVLSPRRRASAP